MVRTLARTNMQPVLRSISSTRGYARSEEGSGLFSTYLTTPQPSLAGGAEGPGEYLLYDMGDAGTCDDIQVGGCAQ